MGACPITNDHDYEADGKKYILIGGGREGYGDLNHNDKRKDVSIDGLCFNVREAQDIIPSMKKLNILRSWAGFEGFTPERLPYIGEVEKYPRVYLLQ